MRYERLVGVLLLAAVSCGSSAGAERGPEATPAVSGPTTPPSTPDLVVQDSNIETSCEKATASGSPVAAAESDQLLLGRLQRLVDSDPAAIGSYWDFSRGKTVVVFGNDDRSSAEAFESESLRISDSYGRLVVVRVSCKSRASLRRLQEMLLDRSWIDPAISQFVRLVQVDLSDGTVDVGAAVDAAIIQVAQKSAPEGIKYRVVESAVG